MEKETYPDKCPITGLSFFMELENEQGERVPTYGGPFDSYTIPIKEAGENEDGAYITERYDHDEGAWVGEETVYIDDSLTQQTT